MKSYEVRRGSNVLGEMAASKLKELVASGEIIKNDEVRILGTTQWYQVSALPKLAEIMPPAVKEQSETQDSDAVQSNAPMPVSLGQLDENPTKIYLLPANIIHHLVMFLKNTFSANFFLNKINVSETCAHILLSVGVILSIICGSIIAIKTDSIQYASIVAAVIIVVIVAQYSAWKSILASKKLLATTPTSIQNVFILDIVGVILLIMGATVFVSSIYRAIKHEELEAFIIGIFVLLIATICSSLAFSPQSCNVQVRPTSSGEEAIGLASFLVKVLLQLGPFFYLAACFAGCFYGFMALYELISNGSLGLLKAGNYSATMWLLLAGGGFYPIVFYFLYLIYYLFIDVFRSILQIGTDVRSMASNSDSNRK